MSRSEDLLWGLLGTDYVDFTIVQEYLAARLGVAVGRYHHVSSNLHVYPDRKDWQPEALLADDAVDYYSSSAIAPAARFKPFPLVKDPEAFERELPEFVDFYSNDDLRHHSPFHEWTEPFLNDVAGPMLTAFWSYRRRAATTMMWAQRVKAEDWRIAARRWIERRLARESVGS